MSDNIRVDRLTGLTYYQNIPFKRKSILNGAELKLRENNLK